ncbi:radical SAM protein, partial [bacterium]|nr:radical SAM protein [bacterium]
METSRPPRLRRIWNPPSPFESRHREWLGEPPLAEVEVFEDHSRTILAHNDSPDIPFAWSVNPYRGCFHACSYCYARPTHEYLGLGAGTDFERRIVVKPEAAALLEAAFRKRSWKGELVSFSGVTDCYQPVEATWKLTRACLEVCARHANPAGIVTKSQLVRRDVDVLLRLAALAPVRVWFSIAFRDEDAARAIEPGAPSIAKRFETMRILADAGIPVGIGVAPIIPGLNDADVPDLLKEAKRCGATSAFRILLRLPGSTREVFLRHLEERIPLRAKRVVSRIRDVRGGKLSESRFGKRGRGEGHAWRATV